MILYLHGKQFGLCGTEVAGEARVAPPWAKGNRCIYFFVLSSTQAGSGQVTGCWGIEQDTSQDDDSSFYCKTSWSGAKQGKGLRAARLWKKRGGAGLTSTEWDGKCDVRRRRSGMSAGWVNLTRCKERRKRNLKGIWSLGQDKDTKLGQAWWDCLMIETQFSSNHWGLKGRKGQMKGTVLVKKPGWTLLHPIMKQLGNKIASGESSDHERQLWCPVAP